MKREFGFLDVPERLFVMESGTDHPYDIPKMIKVGYPEAERGNNCVPYIKFRDKYYKAGPIATVPLNLASDLCSAREYTKIPKLPKEIDPNSIYVFNFGQS